MRKTRIKLVTAKDGSQRFYPQYRLLGWWLNFEESHECGFSSVSHDTLEQATTVIDHYLKSMQEVANKKSSTTHQIYYP